MEYQDYYDTLGVAKDADQDTIKKAYRKLARKYHPDVSKAVDAEAKFKELGEAYEVLKDPEKRAAYDQLGQNWQAGQDFQPPPDWGDGGFRTNGFGGGAQSKDFSDFFANLFGQEGFERGGHGVPPQSRDQHARINLTLEELYAEKPVELFFRDPVSRQEKRLRVKVPPQMRDGQSFRLAGQGTPAGDGGRAGDLYVEVFLVPNPKFRVEGSDVYSEVSVSPWEAVLGVQIPVDTLGGTVNLKVPERSSNGSQLRLKNRGLPGPNRGHHFISLRVQVPDDPSEEELELFRALAGVSSFNPRDTTAEDSKAR